MLRENGFVSNDADQAKDIIENNSFRALLSDSEQSTLQNLKRNPLNKPQHLLEEQPVESESEEQDVQKSHEVRPENKRLLKVAFFGNPNAGKSTLINRLLKQKASAVSMKPQTTRERLLGLLIDEDVQLALYDTPGVLDKRALRDIYRKHKDNQQLSQLLNEAMEPAVEADMILIIVDAKRPTYELDHLLEKLSNGMQGATKKPELVCVLNKIDMLQDKDAVDQVRTEIITNTQDKIFTDVIAVSAKIGTNIETLLSYMKMKSIKSEWMMDPPGKKTSMVPHVSARDRVKEVVREKIYRRLNREIPYQTSVEVNKFDLYRRGEEWILNISVNVHVQRFSHKLILLGAIKDIHTHSISNLKSMYAGVQPYLSLEVICEEEKTNTIPHHESRRQELERRKKQNKK
ncbi:GTPase Era [Acrasis kona]|uniref:GTPase Era n=1 Tax=Acrasis kona TaxID=1008807 RepID=A0AAW2YTL3_9EUKA